MDVGAIVWHTTKGRGVVHKVSPSKKSRKVKFDSEADVQRGWTSVMHLMSTVGSTSPCPAATASLPPPPLARQLSDELAQMYGASRTDARKALTSTAAVGGKRNRVAAGKWLLAEKMQAMSLSDSPGRRLFSDSLSGRQGSTSAPLPALWAPFAPAIAGITTPNAYFSCPNSGATAGLHMHARDQFRATCPHSRWRIISIELCVNTVKWDSYCYKKRIMSKVLHGAVNEQLVFHGTAHPIIDSICNHGFNRSYSHTAMYGHGTYFARDAKYSSEAQYAQPNSSGEQQMLLCRILAGEPCEGRQGMVQPSAKPSGVLHESMVNDVADPSIYVLSAGSDDCAYPEYRITFRRC